MTPTIKCRLCHTFTKTSEPIFVKRLNYRKFCVAGICAVCGDTKYKFLNDNEVDKLPSIFFQMPIPNLAINTFVDTNKKTHNLFPAVAALVN